MATQRFIKDINPGAADSSPSSLTRVGNTLYFTADDGVNGPTLWKSDGSTAGTIRVSNRRLFISPPTNLTSRGNTLFFTADDGVSGTELWRSRGTAASTVQLRDIYPGSRGSDPRHLTQVDRTLFFSADTGSRGTGRELWRSDGTTTGTSIVSNITGANNSSNPSNLTPVGNSLFFTVSRQIWKSDGSDSGTARVSNVSGFGLSNSEPRELTAIGSTVFFSARDGGTFDEREIWRSDGTAAGTVQVSDFGALAGIQDRNLSDPRNLTAVGKTLFFTAVTRTTGRELWATNGTPASTILVADIRPSPDSSDPRYLTKVGNTLFFAAFDDTSGTELWKSDGTASGTVRVADINPGNGSSTPQNLTAVGNTLFFTADDGVSGRELWQSDGTAAGTVRVADIRPGAFGSNPADLEAVGDTLFFTADDGNRGRELWALDLSDPPPPTLSLVRDTGPTDGITRNGSVDVADLQDNASWQYRVITDGSPGPWTEGVGSSFIVPVEGNHRVIARQRDAFGTLSEPSEPLLFTVDTTPPAPRITRAGSNNRITGAANSRTIRGTGADPLSPVQILRGNLLLGRSRSDSNGRFSYRLTPDNIEVLRQGTGKRLRARQRDGAGNTGTSDNFTFAINTTTASPLQDLLTGDRFRTDRFIWSTRYDSRLNRYDTITNFETIDRLRVQGSRYRSTLSRTTGIINNLSANAIGNLLTRRSFAADSAAAFRVRGLNGTFIALNDSRPGFQANRNAVIFLEGFNINQTANSASII